MNPARLPLPIAALVRRAANARSPKERHDAAYFAWEASVRIAAAIAVHAEPEVLARPSLGYWVSVLERRGETIREASLLDAYVWFESVVGEGRGRPASIAAARLFEAVPAYRNRIIGHGSMRATDFYDAGAAKLIDALLAAWDLGLFLPLQSVLIYVDSIEIDPAGNRRARTLSLMGDAVSLERDRSADTSLMPSRIFVRTGERCVSAHPLLLYEDGEAGPRVLFLNGRSRTARYLDYVKGTEIVGRALAVAFPEVERDLDSIGTLPASESTGPALEEQPESPAPPVLDENVQFTVYRPAAIAVEKWVPLLAFAHLSDRPPDADPSEPSPQEQVQAMVKQVLGDRASQYAGVSQDSALAIPREGEITFVPEFPGLDVNPPRRSFLWVEQVHQEQFRIRAKASMAGKSVRGRMSVLFGSILLAEVRLTIAVEKKAEERAPLQATTARRFRRIFASHAVEDAAVVAEFERYASAFGDQFVSGWSSARATDAWPAHMRATIAEADVFQLFWSTHAMRSSLVLGEVDCALALARPDFIRPLYWQEPLPRDDARGLPPPGISGLPFLRIGAQQPSSSLSIGEGLREEERARDQAPAKAAPPPPAGARAHSGARPRPIQKAAPPPAASPPPRPPPSVSKVVSRRAPSSASPARGESYERAMVAAPEDDEAIATADLPVPNRASPVDDESVSTEDLVPAGRPVELQGSFRMAADGAADEDEVLIGAESPSDAFVATEEEPPMSIDDVQASYEPEPVGASFAPQPRWADSLTPLPSAEPTKSPPAPASFGEAPERMYVVHSMPLEAAPKPKRSAVSIALRVAPALALLLVVLALPIHFMTTGSDGPPIEVNMPPPMRPPAPKDPLDPPPPPPPAVMSAQPKGRVAITARGFDAAPRVFIDGVDHGAAPLELDLNEGAHRIELRVPNVPPIVRNVAVNEGDHLTITIDRP